MPRSSESRSRSRRARWTLAVALVTFFGTGAPAGQAAERDAASAAEQVDDFHVVDCLLPGKVRRLGRRQTFVDRRRPIRATALECRVRGGEYTAYDRSDYSSALAVWMAEASAGSAEAQYYVGEIYERGLSGEPDYESAALWLRRSAEQGFAPAQVGLGHLYEAGLGVDKDPVAALDWYRKASDLPEEYVLLEGAELEALEASRNELEQSRKEIGDLESRLETLEKELEAVRSEAQAAEEEDREEEVRLNSVVEELRRELTQRRRSAERAEEQVASLEEQLERLATDATPATATPGAGPKFGPYHAVVIGNREYRKLPELASAVSDARAIADLLKKKYGFNVKLLLNATRYEIMATLNEIREKLTEADNLLVFYAGHSQRDQEGRRGWWQPVDADPVSRVNWISNQVLSDHLQLISARHALVVADAAYQATLTRSSIPRLPRGMTAERRAEMIAEMLERRTRLVLASGELSPVPAQEHSVFSGTLLEILGENSDVLPASAVYQSLSQRLPGSAQTAAPKFAPLRWAHHEGGADFFFVPQE